MQRDYLALTLVVMQAVVSIIGLTIIGLQNIAISKMVLQLGELIAKTH